MLMSLRIGDDDYYYLCIMNITLLELKTKGHLKTDVFLFCTNNRCLCELNSKFIKQRGKWEGKSKVSRPFYKTQQWVDCRKAFIKTTNGLCTRCFEKGIIKAGYIVHHKVYINDSNIEDADITLNFENLEFLCHECHNIEHFKGKGRRKEIKNNSRIFFDSNGQVSPR